MTDPAGYVRINAADVRLVQAPSVEQLVDVLNDMRPGGTGAYAIVLDDLEHEPDVYVLGGELFGAVHSMLLESLPEIEPVQQLLLADRYAAQRGTHVLATGRVLDPVGDAWVPPAEVSSDLVSAGREHESDSTEPAGGPATVVRHPHMALDANEPLAASARVAIRVFCDEEPLLDEDAVPVELPATTEESEFELTVWLALSDHFACDEPTKRLTIYRDEPESTTAEFAVSVVDKPPAGAGYVSAIFSYRGQPSGHVTRRVAIEVALDQDRYRAPQRAVVRVGQQLPDLTIEIKATGRDQRTFACCVTSPQLVAGLAPRPFSWRVDEASEVLVANHMAGFVEPNLSDRQRAGRLRIAGRELWTLTPQEIRDAFWALAETDGERRLRSILVVTDEPAMPWELLVPHGEGHQEREPLGVDFDVGRWVSKAFDSPAHGLDVIDSFVLAPWYPLERRLPKADEEATYVCNTFNGRRIDPATYSGIDEDFAAGGRKLFHVVCHGQVDAAGKLALGLAQGGQLTAADLAEMASLPRAVRDSAPMVFLNACDVGRLQPALLGADGFGPAFVDLGAHCVIAPLWSVDDTVAHAFATKFYATMIEEPETPFATIIRRLRASAYADDGADTWAAYCFYGNPLTALRRPAT